jgi:hypothetical protein
MPYYRRKRFRYRVWEKLSRWVWLVLGLAGFGLLWWWLAQLGPRSVEVAGSEQEEARVDETSQALQRELEQIRGELMDAEGADALALLEEAVVRQREIAQRPQAGQAEQRKLRTLEQERDTALAVVMSPQVRELLERGKEAHAQGELVAAEAAWREALRLQQQVNRSGADTGKKNFVREGRLEQLLQELAAEPLAEEVAAARLAAEEAQEAGQWADALTALTTAREVQMRLNAEYARSRFADLRTLDEIERAMESLDASDIAAAVDDYEAEGDAALAQEDFAAAVTAYEAARQAQLRLNREFSRSRFLSSPRVEQLEIKRQTTSSLPLLRGIREDVQAIDALLRRREVGLAAERITTTAAQLEEVFAQLGKSEALDAGLRLKLGYLATQVERLGEIQDTVYERVRPLPGVAERRLLNSEFAQSLYLQVMRVNPSRHAGRAFPVDSVNWRDAMTCCERLSWILGRPVRLPTADEFRIAVGDPYEVALMEYPEGENPAASAAMAVLEPNAAGYFDLLGNVAEWLQPGVGQSDDAAQVGGGSYLDAPEVLRTVPVEAVPRTERARHIGFRVVVEFDAP